MLLKGYRKEIFRPECNPRFQSLHCIAHLDVDIAEVLPYLNAVLGGHQYSKEPPSLTFKYHGKLITLHSREIAVNALKQEEEADKILEWLKKQINETWINRDHIEPCFDTPDKPRILDILKLLPKTNCRECGQLTCMVFASLVAEGIKGVHDCPPLDDQDKYDLQKHLEKFFFDV